MRILLIENNEDDVRLIQRRLARMREPFVLECADRLSAGLERLAAGDIDVVLLDLGLPDSTGFDTFDRVHTHAPAVPIVVLTGSYANEQLALRAVREGAQDYLFKSHVDGETVVHAVRYAIERKRTAQALQALNGTLEQRTVELEGANARLNSVTHELRNANEHLAQLILIDPLTGLLNRRGLQQALSQEIARSRREGSMLCALLVDLDDFKRINDTLGHTVGDEALVKMTRQLKASVRATDHAARIGGDEFVILLPGTRPAEGMLIAEKLRLAVSGTSIALSSLESVTVTASLGLVQVSEGTTSVEELLSQAELMLQRSKHAGKNRVSYEHDDARRDSEAHDPRADLLSTLCRGDGFHAVRQPIFSLAEMNLVGYELLSRFAIEAFAMPDDFFRVALQANMLTLVDHHCLRTCLAAAAGLPPDARWHLNLFPSTIVNIPVQELLNELQGPGHTATSCVEISEQQVLGEPSYLVEAVRAFQQAGILIAIDDVGFGRSSLESLIVLQPQIVKIDKGWVSGMGRDEARTRSLRRLLKVVEDLGAEPIAEGIETSDDLEMLKALGVKYGQGFLLGRPT